MPTSVETVVNLYTERRNALAPVHNRMRELQAAVNGDMDLPLPELDRNERPMVANLIAQGLDQNAMRVASTLPDVRFPALRDGIKASEEKARKRRLAVLGWWRMNKLQLLTRKRARHLLGYACAPVIIRPDHKRHIPRWHERDPLSTFWPPGCDHTPPDTIFTFTRTLKWLKTNYPEEAARINKGNDPSPDDRYEILEYADDEEMFLVCLGRSNNQPYGAGVGHYQIPQSGGAPFVLLGERVPNRIGMCPVVIPSRIVLDRLTGQFDAAVPLFWNQAMMMALELIAVKRGIFEDEWIVSRQNETAQVVHEADGLRGERGMLTGGDIKKLSMNPGIQTYPTIDRIERSLRLAGGIPAEYGGESPSNIRTGRRGAQVLSSAVDYSIQEAQEILASALEEENRRAIAIAKVYFRGERSFHVSWNGKSADVTYDPAEIFETDEHDVRYSLPGASINELVVGAGQRVGMGSLSKESWMAMDPLVEDPDVELRRVEVEALRSAQLQSIQSQAANGAIPPADLALIIKHRVEGLAIEEAVIKAQEEVQERQATTVDPAVPGSPETMPGLAQPEMGAEAGAAIPEPGPSQQNLVSLLNSLARPQQMARVAAGR